MSDSRELPHVYKFVCVLRVDADVSCIVSEADSTQLLQHHAHCNRLQAHASQDKELTYLNWTLGGEKQDHVSPPKDRCFPLGSPPPPPPPSPSNPIIHFQLLIYVYFSS